LKWLMYRAAFLGTVLLCVTPVLVLVASTLHVPLLHASPPPVVDRALTVLACLAMLAAFGICVVNRRLTSFNRAEKHVSPIPFVGSFLVVSGGVLGYGSLPLAIFGFALLALDPGGGLLALVTIVRNRKVLFGRR
jgi:hypothetical protein